MSVLYIIVFLQTTLVVFVVGAILTGWANDKIMSSVFSAGIPLGALTVSQAEDTLRNNFQITDSSVLVLESEKMNYEIPLKSIRAAYDYCEAVKSAYAVGRSGVTIIRISEHLGNRAGRVDIPLRMIFDSRLLEEELKKINGHFAEKPENARIVVEDNTTKVIPGKEGFEIDLPEIMRRITGLTAGMEARIEIPVRSMAPEINDNQLTGLTDVLGECTTWFYTDSTGRGENIVRASELIDGTLVLPGEVFSYNEKISPVNEGNGYKKAYVIADEELVQDYGGGICQVSSTLYGAVLLSGLKVNERYPHTKLVKYVAPGLDATVSDSDKDFRFTNNLGSPVYIISSSEATAGYVRVTVIGRKDNNIIYEIDTEEKTTSPGIVLKYSAALPRGSSRVIGEGSPGIEVSVFRLSVSGDSEIGRELISHDIYLPEPKIVEVGHSPIR